MDFETTSLNGAESVKLPSRVDLGNVAAFANALHVAFAKSDHGVIIDCSRAQLIDSTALGALVKVRRELGDRAHRLVLASVSDSVMQVLQITRLDTVFRRFDDPRGAASWLAEAA